MYTIKLIRDLNYDEKFWNVSAAAEWVRESVLRVVGAQWKGKWARDGEKKEEEEWERTKLKSEISREKKNSIRKVCC